MQIEIRKHFELNKSKTPYQTFWMSPSKGKCTPLYTSVKKEEKSQINDFSYHSKKNKEKRK